MAIRRSIPACLLNETALIPPPVAEAFPVFEYKARPQFKPSAQQRLIFNWVREGAGNAILMAVAGAGKTTTLIEALKLMTGDVFFGAFNAKIVKEIEAKAEKSKVLRPGIYIKTFHAAGLRAFMSRYSHLPKHQQPQVNDRKTYGLVDELIKELGDVGYPIKSYAAFVVKLVSFAKQFLIGIVNDEDKPENWLKLIEHFALDQELPDGIKIRDAISITQEIFKRSRERCSSLIDFDDMLYAPLAHKCRFYQYDWVLIDEAQDCNLARRVIAQKMLRPSGRLMAVGDKAQAIYGFTGAGGDSLSQIEKMFDCITLDLTTTYRCARAIVTHAHQWVEHIQAREDAPEGIVRSIAAAMPAQDGKPAKEWFEIEKPNQGDAIICRYTKPLVKTAYMMIRAGMACKIEGRDVGLNLIKLAQRWKLVRIDALDARLDEYLDNELNKSQLKNDTKREADAIDQVQTLRIFIERARANHKTNIVDVVNDIQSLFEDNVTGVVTLCTGHKSKGREWPRVFWLQPPDRNRPGPEWQMVEEINIKYVITTRAMNELILVPFN
jgi:DNA helicase-2/ATP-dependent DNA helicase PcrA